MQLEYLISEAVAGFGVGFALGRSWDRRHTYNAEYAEANINAKKSLKESLTYWNGNAEIIKIPDVEKEIGILRGLQERMDALYSIGMGGIGGLVNSTLQRLSGVESVYSLPTGMLTTGIASFLGIKLGRYLSKKSRNKRSLSEDEKKGADRLAYRYKLMAINECDENTKQVACEELTSYLGVLSEKHRSKKIDEEVYNILNSTVIDIIRYNSIQGFLNENFGHVGVATLNNPKYDTGTALIIQEEGIYVAKLGMESFTSIKEEGSHTEIVEPRVEREKEKINWDRSVQGIIDIADRQPRDTNLFLVNSPGNAPFPFLMMSVLNAFTDSYARKNVSAEKPQA